MIQRTMGKRLESWLRGRRGGRSGVVAVAARPLLTGSLGLSAGTHVTGSSEGPGYGTLVISTLSDPVGAIHMCEDCTYAVTMGGSRNSRWRRWRNSLTALFRGAR
jgi:hypothetical protein